MQVQFSEHGKGQLILKCPFGVSKSTKKENENLPSSIGSVKYYFYLLFIHFRLTHRSYFSWPNLKVLQTFTEQRKTLTNFHFWFQQKFRQKIKCTPNATKNQQKKRHPNLKKKKIKFFNFFDFFTFIYFQVCNAGKRVILLNYKSFLIVVYEK